MRFRADIEQVSTFYRIAQTIQALTKKCTIRWTPEDMQIIVPSGENDGGVQVWSKIKIENLFSEYRIQSNANNMINMEVSTSLLCHALKLSQQQSATRVIVKLAKKDHAVLSFEVEGTTQQRKRVKAVHDVQIKVLGASDIEKLIEPQCPDPDVYIFLPRLSNVRTVAEHMKPLSTHLGVSANRSGGFKLKIQTEDVALETSWSGCDNPNMEYPVAEGEEAEDPETYFHAIVSIRSFLQFLSSHVVSTSTIAGICQDHCLIMYVYVFDGNDAGGVLTFYIPVKIS